MRLPDRVRVLGAGATSGRMDASDEIRRFSPFSRLAAGKMQLDFGTELSNRSFRFDTKELRHAGGVQVLTVCIISLRDQIADTRLWSS